MSTSLLIIVICACVFPSSARSFNEQNSYTVPPPKIEAFSPQGFRVSIEDTPGIRLFAFHGNINNAIFGFDAGQYSNETRRCKNGRWTFEERQVRLHVGDKICYWLFVIKDSLGYRLNGECYIIKELLPSPFTSQKPALYNTEIPYFAENLTKPPQRKPVTEFVTISPELVRNTLLCEETVLKTTQALLSLRAETENLKKINKLLLAGLDEYPGSRQMQLTGIIPPEGSAIFVLQAILREKLDLKPEILWAVREGTNKIVFEIPSVLDKFKIMLAAKERLKTNQLEFS